MLDDAVVSGMCQEIMAYVRKRKESQFWYAVVRLPGQKNSKHFSTGLTDEKEALAFAVAAERTANKHREKPHQLRTALARLADDFVPVESDTPSVWLVKWADGRKGEVAKSTSDTYVTTTKAAAAWLDARGVRHFADLNTALITEMRDSWAGSVSPSTANDRVKHLRIAFGDAIRHKLLEENPAKDVRRLKEPKTNRRKFQPDELKRLLDSLSGEWKAMTLLGLYTGQRINDLSTLKWKALNLRDATITFEAGKTGALVALPLLSAPLAELRTLAKGRGPEDYVFPSIQQKPAPSRSKQFRKFLFRVGLAKNVTQKNAKIEGSTKKREQSELSFHSLRHTATSALKSAGVSDSIARAIIGHESEAISREYTHLDMATMREAMEKMVVVS